MRRLIFNADDYGLSPLTSAGILKAACGVVRSTSVMANLCTELEARALAASRLSAGVHLNLSFGKPLTADYPRELLRANSCFDKARALDGETWDSEHYRQAAQAEWRAQIARARELGIQPDHLNSHHHTHLLPALFPAALDLARQEGLALRSTLNERPAADAAGVPTPRLFFDCFYGRDNISRLFLLRLLEPLQGTTTEVMCHPGRLDPALAGQSSYIEERQMELDVLGDPELAQELEGLGWELGGYKWD